MKHLIAPSILSADFANLERDIIMLNQSDADWIHVDIMDGLFVPNISFGFPVVKTVKKHSKKPLDVHLMIARPERYIKEFKNAGADVLTVHFEACPHLHRTIQVIRQEGMKAGVAINPHTPAGFLEEIIADVDLVLVMTVNPGFGGQKFIDNSFEKIKKLANLIIEKGCKVMIEADGGVTDENAAKLVEHGVNILVAGNHIFSSEDPARTIKELKNCRKVNV